MTTTGVVTFLFTDVEGSSLLWEGVPARMQAAMGRHDAVSTEMIREHRGELVDMAGDGVFAVFPDPLDALHACVDLQREMMRIGAAEGIELRLRCGMHAGVDYSRSGEYVGPDVNRTARLTSAAHGGQILLSHAAAVLLRDRLPQEMGLSDLGTVRLRDLSTPEHVYQLLHPELRRDFPAPRATESTPNNLPQQLTSFVGRRRGLADLEQSLSQRRLLTLTGAGGIGKTRMSLQLAARVLDDFPDGVWLVELAAITDPQLVAQTVASTIGIKETAAQSLLDAIDAHVRERRMLLLLDNCEHLVHACADLASRLLQASTQLKILATSREPLRVPGEASYPVSTLDVPDRGLDLERLRACDAVRLFVDRAVSARADFQLTPGNAEAVAAICRRLDGIPLALELAAARVRSMSVASIAVRLSDRFGLLVRGERTALPRQQTLRALIEWSYDLLSETERVLFGRLAVFAGSFTLDAAEAVGKSTDAEAARVIDPLTDLVEKSLVALEAEDGRYRLLESIREYAQERLAQAGEERMVRDRHLAYYVALVEKARPELGGSAQKSWLARLDQERENILAANSWCDSAEHGEELGLTLAHCVKLYWFNRGLVTLGHRFAVEALARAGAQDRTSVRARGLFDAGQMCSYMGRYAEASRYLQESLAIARELGDEQRIAAVLQPLGLAALGEGKLKAAHRYLKEALALARKRGNKRELAAAVNMLATLHRLRGELDAAEPLYREAVALANEVGDQDSTAVGLLNLSIVAIGRADAAQARRLLTDALTLADLLESKSVGQSVFEVLAGLAASVGDPTCAARFFGAAEMQIMRTGLQRDPADEAFLQPLIERARIALGPEGFGNAEASGRALGYAEAFHEARAWLASSEGTISPG